MKKKLKQILLIGVILLMPYACSSNKKMSVGEEEVGVEAYVPTVNNRDGFYVSGQVTARQTATISTRMMGFVQKIHVKPGDGVIKGELLVSISNSEVLAQKAKAEAMLVEAEAATHNAKKDYERFKRLRDQNSVSDKELENMALQYTSMNAKLEMAKQSLSEVNAMLSYTDIKAPFSGIVTRKMIDEGSMANPGMPLLVIEEKGSLIVEASVPENYISYVQLGDKAEIELRAISKKTVGTIIELSPSAYGTGGQYSVKLSLEREVESSVQSGMYAHVFVPNEQLTSVSDKLMVDVSSVIYRDQLTGVYVVNDQNQAILRWVRLGDLKGKQVEVLSGISQHEQVIRNPEGKLYNGVKVMITK